MPFHEIIANFFGNPIVFFLLVFVLSVLIAIILPIPVEAFLTIPLAAPGLTPSEKANLIAIAVLAVALGKALGAWLVFLLGLRVEAAMHRWSERSELIAKVLSALERFVRWTGTFGMFVLLSIPLMSDTAVLYFYALFNEEGKTIDQRLFIVTNFLGGVSRVAVFFILAVLFFRGWLVAPP